MSDTSATVLLVEDQEGTRHVFASWLRRAGHIVHEAATGQAALELLSRHRFNLAVLDVNLPDMSGLDICARIKSTRATSGIPVLHVSGSAVETEERIRALNIGADAYLIEPVERGELLATVAALLRHSDARRTAEQLATSLERLHQSGLLMSSASGTPELLQAASTGLSSVFGRSSAVLAALDGAGQALIATPTSGRVTARAYPAEQVAALCRSARVGQPVPAEVAQELFGSDQPVTAAAVSTPHGASIGVILLQDDTTGGSDGLMLDHFAQALAIALENQRLYAIEHRAAQTLQRAMLPAALPEPPGLQIAVRYQAASESAEVGGDFYDVIAVDEHNTVILIGDVAGHSLQAATVMAELRHTAHAFALIGLAPSEIIGRVNEHLIDSRPYLTATLVVAAINTADDTVRIANAGQIPPLLRTHGEVEIITEHGALLGVRRPAPPTTVRPFPPGALLVAATDGLIERRDELLRVGIERLGAAVENSTGPAPEICQKLVDDLGRHSPDDIAIVAVSRITAVSAC